MNCSYKSETHSFFGGQVDITITVKPPFGGREIDPAFQNPLDPGVLQGQISSLFLELGGSASLGSNMGLVDHKEG